MTKQTRFIIALLTASSLFAGLKTWQKDFLVPMVESAQQTQVVSGIPTSVIVAQGILESYWGASYLAKNANNYFGIKADPLWLKAGGEYITRNDYEYYSGRRVLVSNIKWRKYDSKEESILDHSRFFVRNQRYSNALNCRANFECFVKEIHKAGYATDPAYTNKILSLIKVLNLNRLDVPSTYWKLWPEFCSLADKKQNRCSDAKYDIKETVTILNNYIDSK